MIVEFVPIAIIFDKRCVMSSIESTCMQDHRKEIINLIINLLSYHEILHVKTVNRVVHWRVLFDIGVLSLESLQSYNQNGW